MLADKSYTLLLILLNYHLSPRPKSRSGTHKRSSTVGTTKTEINLSWQRNIQKVIKHWTTLETKTFLPAIQVQVINTNIYKKFIIEDRNTQFDKHRRCHRSLDTTQHITSSCTYLVNTDYLYKYSQICHILD